MARGRMISKSWSTSAKRAALYREADTLAEFCLQLFPLLVVHSDDYGRLDADPETVKLVCDPGSPRRVAEFAAALAWFERVGLAHVYTVEGRKWLQIDQFDAHQPGLLSKRSIARSPSKPTDTETDGDSVLTKPNLTKPNLTLSSCTSCTPPADDLVDLWNQLVSLPIPKVTKLTPGRRAKINARLKEFPDLALWRTVISWINQQDWCRASGAGDHANWTATLDWLCRSEDQVQRYLERSTQHQPRQPVSAAKTWACPHQPPCLKSKFECHRDWMLEQARKSRAAAS